MGDLRDKVVVVTGAGSGIGRATAKAFARRGARLHLVDVDGERVAAVASELRKSRHRAGRVFAHEVDCRDAAAMQDLAAVVYERNGRVDVLHNNAGVCVAGPVEALELDDWRWIVDVNVWGVVHGVHAFVPRMIEQGTGGHVVNTASMAGLVGLPLVAPYCATKFAVVGLSEALAAELGVHGIRVTVVCPGAVRTNVLRDARLHLPDEWAERLRTALSRHAPSPDLLAERIVEAVRQDRSVVIAAGHLLPLWLLKRTSISLYQRTARRLTRWARRTGAGWWLG